MSKSKRRADKFAPAPLVRADAPDRDGPADPAAPQAADPTGLLRLQRSAGNRTAVSALQRAQGAGTAAKPAKPDRIWDTPTRRRRGQDDKTMSHWDVPTRPRRGDPAEEVAPSDPGPAALDRAEAGNDRPLPGRLALEDTAALEDVAKDKHHHQRMAELAWVIQGEHKEGGPSGWAKAGEGKWVPADKTTEPEIQDEWTDKAGETNKGAAVAEVMVTPLLVGLAGDNGGELVGLDHRLKTVSSLARKLRGDKGASPIRDALRYTAQFPTESLTAGGQSMFDGLRGLGCTPVTIKNTFVAQNGKVPTYRGLNTTWQHPVTKTVFELQVHTPESFHTKEVMNHSLYEGARLVEKGDKDKAPIDDRMGLVSSRIPSPPGIEQIEEYPSKAKVPPQSP